jgi:NOL1/NOP2/fmu family ribosome biogenesis protein
MHNQSTNKEKNMLPNDLQHDINQLQIIAELRSLMLKHLKKHFAIKVKENEKLQSELSHLKSLIYGHN